MPAHPELVAAFRDGLFGGRLPPGATARAPEETARRFAVYRNNVVSGLVAALRRRFPVIERLVGPEFFAALARVFLETHPPETPVLLAWGEALPRFLESFPPVKGLPYLADVARLELARGRAYHAADAEPLAPEALAAAAAGDPAGLRLVLHPSVELLASAHPVVSIWQANQPAAPSARVAARGPEWALIARTASNDVTLQRLDRDGHALIAALTDGETLGAAAAAAPGLDPAPLLALLMTHGLIVRPTDRPTEGEPE